MALHCHELYLQLGQRGGDGPSRNVLCVTVEWHSLCKLGGCMQSRIPGTVVSCQYAKLSACMMEEKNDQSRKGKVRDGGNECPAFSLQNPHTHTLQKRLILFILPLWDLGCVLTISVNVGPQSRGPVSHFQEGPSNQMLSCLGPGIGDAAMGPLSALMAGDKGLNMTVCLPDRRLKYHCGAGTGSDPPGPWSMSVWPAMSLTHRLSCRPPPWLISVPCCVQRVLLQ